MMMGVAQFISRLRRRQKEDSPGAWTIPTWQAGRSYYPQADLGSLIKKYASWVYACAHLNATNCAQVPLRLYVSRPKRLKTKLLFRARDVAYQQKSFLQAQAIPAMNKGEDIEELIEHPFLSVLRRPNPWTNHFDLLELLFLNLELTGNAFWTIVVGPLDEPLELWPLGPQHVKIIPDKARFISGYEYQAPGADKVLIAPKAMIHFKYPNPADLYWGLGPLAAVVLAADLAEGMNVYENSLMANRAQPDMALMLPTGSTPPGEKELERTYKQWHQRFGGLKKTGKLVVLTGGAELKPVSLTPKEMAFLQGRRATREEIAAVFGVPMSKLTCEDVNRANAEAGDCQYCRNTLRPKVLKIQEALNSQLIPRYDDSGLLFCAFDNPVQDDLEYILKERESNLRTGYASINQERQQEGLEPVSWGDVPLMPITYAPLFSSIPSAPPPVKAKSARRFPPLNHPTNFIDEQFEQAMADYFARQGAAILSRLDAEKAGKVQRGKALADDLTSAWFDMNAWNDDLSETMGPFVRRTLFAGGTRALAQFVSDRPFDPISIGVLRALEFHRQGAVVGINATKAHELRMALADGIAAGEPLAQLRGRIVNIYEQASRYDATRIARTETIWAFNEGAVQGYKQSGVITKKIWVASGDERSCDFCLSMDGKVIEVDKEYFAKGDSYEAAGHTITFVYEGISHPPIHPQCRCAIAPEVETI